MTGRFSGPHLSGLLDCPPEEEQLFGNGSFSRIRVADNGKSSPPVNFLLIMFFHDLKLPGKNKSEEKSSSLVADNDS
jgi:hypothetical protein